MSDFCIYGPVNLGKQIGVFVNWKQQDPLENCHVVASWNREWKFDTRRFYHAI